MFEFLFEPTFERELKQLQKRYLKNSPYTLDDASYKKEELKLEKKYNKIDPLNFEILTLKADYPSESLQKTNEFKLQFLDIKHNYELISDYDYEMEVNNIVHSNYNDIDKKILELETKYKYNKISELEYYKQINDLKGKPWVAVHINNVEDDTKDLQIEVQYNTTFIKRLTQQGYTGNNEELVEQWLKMVYMSSLDENDIKDLITQNDYYDDEDEELSDDEKNVIILNDINKDEEI